MWALRVVRFLAFLGAAALIVLAAWVQFGPALAPRPVAALPRDPVHGPPIAIFGPIDDGMVRRVRATIAAVPHPPAQVVLRSAGGSEAAARALAEAINRIGAEVVVTDQALCSSACVILLAEIPKDRRKLAPTAWLRVHGLTDSIAFFSTPSMAPAIGKLSANWLAFLRGCRSQPLTERSGIAMQWQEIQRVDSDPHAIDCESIGFRTLAWTTAHVTPDLFMTR